MGLCRSTTGPNSCPGSSSTRTSAAPSGTSTRTSCAWGAPRTTTSPSSTSAASRHHCQGGATRGDQYVVVDLGSQNGTRLNGNLIERSRLKPGDVIGVGSARVWFEKAPPPDAESPRERPLARRSSAWTRSGTARRSAAAHREGAQQRAPPRPAAAHHHRPRRRNQPGPSAVSSCCAPEGGGEDAGPTSTSPATSSRRTCRVPRPPSRSPSCDRSWPRASRPHGERRRGRALLGRALHQRHPRAQRAVPAVHGAGQDRSAPSTSTTGCRRGPSARPSATC